ncbi:MAG TPA: L-threonylcarbamoyladenylate synthase [Verrucomicrobiae bacterium]|nr:L-threonylcarbamoyladenylate synthase [Verrucomicrobiae bacterium]
MAACKSVLRQSVSDLERRAPDSNPLTLCDPESYAVEVALTGAEVLPTDTPELFEQAASRAAELLRAGQVVALPTETVYGLAANALDPAAVARIFAVKGRPANNPIIVHVADLDLARSCVANFPAIAERLARAFWPGPLTLVLPKNETIPDIVTGGGSTVGIRWPSHPFMQAVIRRCGFPLAAPSANLSNQVSPTNAQHVLKQLGRRISMIIDGGQSHVGIESTVLDVSVVPPCILRPGMIGEPALLAVTGELQTAQDSRRSILKSPGLLRKHYAPRARLVLWTWESESELRSKLMQHGFNPGQSHVIAHTNIPSDDQLGSVNVIPHDAEAFARAIYGQLHACDEAGARWIIVEAVPDTNEWRAISDRLNRAAN